MADLAIPHSASQIENYLTVSLGVVTLDCAKVASPVDALNMLIAGFIWKKPQDAIALLQ